MAVLLARQSAKYRAGERPNADAIAKAVLEVAYEFMPNNERGLLSLHKKLSTALKQFGPEIRSHRVF